MALTEKLQILEEKVSSELQALDRSFLERQDILYSLCHGLGIKLDILQAIVLETINELSDEVKLKVLNRSNLESIAETAQEELQRRMDILGWGEDKGGAPLAQLEQDKARIDDI